MSWVANLMLQADLRDESVVNAVSAWLENDAPRRPGGDVDGNQLRGVGSLALLTGPGSGLHWGGWKYPECSLWGGVLNYADVPALLAYVTGAPWRYPGRVQILLMDQGESYFRLYMYRDGDWRQYAPPPPLDADDQCAW
jgi:hypothetical protein